MAIQEIVVQEHKVRMGTSQEHSAWSTVIRQILTEELVGVDLQKMEVFNLRAEFAEFHAGSANREIIFGNGARRHMTTATQVQETIELKFGSIEKHFTVLKQRESGLLIKDDNGVVVAEYIKEMHELYIGFDIFKEYNANRVEMFRYIIKKWYAQHWKVKALEDSWLHTSDKQALTKRFEARFKQQAERQIRDDRDRAKNYESRIENYKREIANFYTNMIRLREQVELGEANIDQAGEKLQKELDLIAKHPKVSDIHIKDGLFNIFVPKVYIYDDRDNRYYGGNYRVQIKLEEADVRFFGDNPRQGFWTAHDPHPHVSGSSGTPCLGSIAGTVAELSSRNELYALALTCISFLESANTGDPAGRRVVNWDRVDEEGNKIEPASDDDFYDEDSWTCDHCGDYQHENDPSHTVYESYEGNADGDGEWGSELYVCEHCSNEHYTWHDELDASVRDGECNIYDEEDEDNE